MALAWPYYALSKLPCGLCPGLLGRKMGQLRQRACIRLSREVPKGSEAVFLRVTSGILTAGQDV